MSSQPPSNTHPGEQRVYRLPTVGPRTQMTTAPAIPSRHQTLPPPSALESQRPRLPPPSHLDPPFAPHSPQRRPQYSDLSVRHQPPYAQQPYGQGAGLAPGRAWPVSAPSQPGPQGRTVSLPPFYPPQNVPYQSRNLGTPYEPLSAAEYASHEPPGRSSLFDDSTYTTRSYQSSGQQPFHSPASSHHSSTTSSSGQLSRTPYHAPPSAPLGYPATKVEGKLKEPDLTDRYIFKVRQQPVAARACGFGERDRRVIDPPAIAQLLLKDFDPDSPTDIAQLQYPFHIVHCSLFIVAPEPDESAPLSDVTSVPDPSKVNAMCRRLMGTLVASPFVAMDPEAPASTNENAKLGCFFMFPDLSVRQTGRYRLRFTLMKVPMHELTEGGQGSIAASVDSDVFEVFVAGSFPGMSASSTLVKELKRQGAAVSLKKGVTPGRERQKRSGNVTEKSGSEGSDGGDASPGNKSRQKKKKRG